MFTHVRSGQTWTQKDMMMSWNGTTFRITGHLCGEFTGPGEFPTQRPVTRSFEVFFDLRLNKRLGKQSWGWWFEMPSCSLWRHCNGQVENWLQQNHCMQAFTHVWLWSGDGTRAKSALKEMGSTSNFLCQLHNPKLISGLTDMADTLKVPC